MTWREETALPNSPGPGYIRLNWGEQARPDNVLRHRSVQPENSSRSRLFPWDHQQVGRDQEERFHLLFRTRHTGTMAGPLYLAPGKGRIVAQPGLPSWETKCFNQTEQVRTLAFSMARHNGPFTETLYFSSTLLVMLKIWEHGGHSVRGWGNPKRLSEPRYIIKQEKQLKNPMGFRDVSIVKVALI